MRRTLLTLALCSCLSTGADQDPKGGVDITFQPSAATTGTPFVTPDGWTITIHSFALRVAATANGAGGPNGPVAVIRPSANCHIRSSGTPAGEQVSIGISLPGIYFGDLEGYFLLPPCGVDAETVARFNQPSEDTAFQYPDIVLEADAVKAGQHLIVKLAVSANGEVDSINKADVTIRANVGIPVIFPIRAEAIFVAFDPEGVTFDELAFADADGDGTITGVELVTAQRQCVTTHPIPFGSIGSGVGDGDDDADAGSDDDDDDEGCDSILLALLQQNAGHLFGEGSLN